MKPKTLVIHLVCGRKRIPITLTRVSEKSSILNVVCRETRLDDTFPEEYIVHLLEQLNEQFRGKTKKEESDFVQTEYDE